MTYQTDSPSPLFTDLLANGRVYVDLVKGADRLLAGNLAWTERILLRLVRRLYTNRLRKLVLILPPEIANELLKGKAIFED